MASLGIVQSNIFFFFLASQFVGSPLTRNGTRTPTVNTPNPDHWTARKFPEQQFNLKQHYFKPLTRRNKLYSLAKITFGSKRSDSGFYSVKRVSVSHSVFIYVFSVLFDMQASFGTHKDPYEEWSYCDFFSEDGIVLESQMVLPVIYELISSLVPLAGKSHLCNIFFLCISGFGTGATHSNMDESIVGMSACVLSCFSCIQLCDSMDNSLPASSVHGILQARMLEWVAMPFSIL